MLITYKFGQWIPDAGDYFNENEGYINLSEVVGFVPNEYGYQMTGRMLQLKESTTLDTLKIYTGATSPRSSNIYPYTTYDSSINAYPGWIYGYDDGSASNDTLRELTAAGTVYFKGRAAGYTDSGKYGWQFTQYGDKIIATNGVDAIQRSTIGAYAGWSLGTFAKNNDTSGTPTAADPRASFVETYKGHLILGDFDLTSGTSGGEGYGAAFSPLSATRYKEAIWYSALNNERRFGTPLTTPAIIGSDYKLFYDQYGAVTGLRSCYHYLMIARQRAIMIMTGPPFNFEVLDDSIGCTYYNSYIRSGQDIYLWTSKGPARITGGVKLEYIGRGKVNRYLTDIVSHTFGYEKYVTGASTIDGRFIAWTIPKPMDAGNFNTLLIYSVETDSFSLTEESTLGKVTPICSSTVYTQPNPAVVPAWTYSSIPLRGIVGVASNLTILDSTATAGVDVPFIPHLGDRYATSISWDGFSCTSTPAENETVYSKIRTSFFKIPSSDMHRSFRIRRVRPILWNHSYPSTTANILDTEKTFAKIRIYPRSRYTSIDKNASPNPDSSTYIEFDASDLLDEKGFVLTDGCPSAEMFSLEFFFYTDNTMRLLYGFEMEIAEGGAYTAGMGYSTS